MQLWKFKVNCFGSDCGEYSQGGITAGDSFAEAVKNLEIWYGDEICDLFIEPTGEEDEPYVNEGSVSL